MARLSIVNITTLEDMQRPAYQQMLSSLPRGEDVECVSLITYHDERELKERIDVIESGLRVRVYEGGIGIKPSLAVARTIVEQLARGEWCLWIDSDDLLITPERVVDCVRNAPGGVGAYYCHVVGMQQIEGQSTVLYHVEQPRLYRKGAGRWVGRMHEVLKIETWTTAKANILIEHHGYICTREKQRERLLRNLRGVAQTLDDCWDDASLREHYLHVLQSNLDAYFGLSNNY